MDGVDESRNDVASKRREQTPKTINAFSRIISAKPKPAEATKGKSRFRQSPSDLDSTDMQNFRNNLLPYAQNPEDYPQQVVSFNDQWVLFKDRFPKATVHLLLVPRDADVNRLHPYDALQQPGILASARAEVERAKDIVASELRRLHGSHSAAERPRLEALESDDPPDELPEGRNWRREVVAGIHTHPSMNHLHIHILSVDRFSQALKHRKHYNSFTTDFFVDLDAFPLSEADAARRKKLKISEMDMLCWRCGRNFGNKFTQLKDHLAEEYSAWRSE